MEYKDLNLEDIDQFIKELSENKKTEDVLIAGGFEFARSLQKQLITQFSGKKPTRRQIKKINKYFEPGYLYTHSILNGWSKELF